MVVKHNHESKPFICVAGSIMLSIITMSQIIGMRYSLLGREYQLPLIVLQIYRAACQRTFKLAMI